MVGWTVDGMQNTSIRLSSSKNHPMNNNRFSDKNKISQGHLFDKSFGKLGNVQARNMTAFPRIRGVNMLRQQLLVCDGR